MAEPAAAGPDDMQAALPRMGEKACCCVANAVVRVIMPPTPTRPHRTELLLCGHHYRLSRQALAAANAVVRELPGTSGDVAAWIHGDRQSSPAPVG